MDKLQFQFQNVAAANEKSNVIIITSISTQDNEIYCLPKEDQAVKNHPLIVASKIFAKLKNSLKKRHQSIKLWITLSPEMKEVYFDDDNNIQFNGIYLEVVNDSMENAITTDKPMITLLEKLIEKNEKSEEKSLISITREFMIEKFVRTTVNANQWMNEFECECNRFNIIQNKRKIEALKLFLDRSCLDWYGCMLIKLSIDSDWNEWKRIFIETFSNKGWSPIRYAISYRYQTGNLVDYAIKKEKLLLEVRKTIDTGTLIDLIATGLPNFIADRIDREAIQTTVELCKELGRLEHFIQKKFITEKNNTNDSKHKMPCRICKSKGKGSRFHREDKCWFNKQEMRLENTSLINVEKFEEAKN